MDQMHVEEPSSTAAASSASSSSKLFHTMKSKLGDAGLLLEDGEEYNYERHMQPITGSGDGLLLLLLLLVLVVLLWWWC